MQEFVTEILDEAQWPCVLNAVIDLLKQRGAQTIRVEFGFVLERDLRGHSSPDDSVVPINELHTLVDRGLREGTIEWNGGSDFRFAPVELPLQLMLCNDADLHFSSQDSALLMDLSRVISRCGLRVYDSGKLVEADSW